jgi:hypothetical protein
VLIALDEDLATTPNNQQTYFDSALGGTVLLGARVAVAAAGVYLYLRDKPAASVTPTAWLDPGRSSGVGLAGRF